MSRPLVISSHSIPLPFALLAIVEGLVSAFALKLGIGVRFGAFGGVSEFEAKLTIVSMALYAMVTVATLGGMGLYFRDFRQSYLGLFLRIASALFITMIVISAIYYLLPALSMGRGIIGFALLFTLVGLLAARGIFYWIIAQERLKKRILVLGAGKKAEKIATRLRRRSDRRGILIVGYVPLQGDSHPVDQKRVHPLLKIGEGKLAEEIQNNSIDEVIIATDDRRSGFPVAELLNCRFQGIQIVELPVFFERETGQLLLDIIDPSWLIYSQGFKRGLVRSVCKRIFDLSASVLLLSVAWPIIAIAAFAIAIESGSFHDLLYQQVRLGLGGKEFGLLKFRSMIPDAEGDGVARWAQEADPRVTRVGKVLRAVRIDEIPQIINIIKGEMSFVGPRPERPEHVRVLVEEIPYYNERLLVKPGLTGWAQIRYPYGASVKDAYEKLQYDLYYAKNYSILLDLFILINTVEVVLFNKGVR